MEIEANKTDGKEGKESSAKAEEPASKAHPRTFRYLTHNCLGILVILEQNWVWWAPDLFGIQDENNLSDTYFSASIAK